MKRLLIATLIFISPIVLLLSTIWLHMFREFLRGQTIFIFIDFHLGSSGKILAGMTFFAVLGFMAYWVSGELVKEHTSRS